MKGSLHNLGCNLGADVNAVTKFDQTCFDLSVPLLTADYRPYPGEWLDRLCLAFRALADMAETDAVALMVA